LRRVLSRGGAGSARVPEGESQGEFVSWLCGIARNKYRNARRKHAVTRRQWLRGHGHTPLEALEGKEKPPDVQLAQDEIHQRVHAAIEGALTDFEAVLVDLVILKDFTVVEIASSTLLSVVVRSYEGKIGTKVKRATSFTLEGWAKLNTDLQALASTDNEAKIEVASAANDEFEISVEEPTVFAFEAARVDECLANVPPLQRQPPVKEPGNTEPNQSIRKLMEFDPARIPDLSEALQEIGPGAEPAILEVMKAGDKRVRERGAHLLKNLPHSPRASLPTPSDMLESADPVLRARAVRMLGEQGTDALPQLEVALKDEHPAVTFLAIDAVAPYRQHVIRS
jgi:DNA-directed RNA polymerase specialized sigma24 family protein